MTFSFSLVPAGNGPRCLLANEESRRIALSTLAAAQRFGALALRLALALLIAVLCAAVPRLLPLFALAVPFWIAIELESKIARRRTHIQR